MRIVCPNCASQYEVAPDAIPEAGRDVQCAKCAEIWFQNRPMQLTLDEPLPLETAPEPQAAAPAPEPVPEPEVEVAPTPAPQPETVAEPSAVFRSLRADRDPAPVEPTAVQEPTAEPKQRQSITPEIQSILQEEAAHSANQLNQASEQEAQPAPIVEQTAAPAAVAPQPDIEELTRQMRALEEERDQLVRKQAETDPNESVTLASAKSLRDILESEVIDPVDITDAVPKPAMPEPSLEKLGLKRPTPIIQPEEVAPTIKPVEPVQKPTLVETAPLAESDVAAKTGKAVFADIDELNPNNADDETDVIEDGLIDFQDEDLEEKASKFSIGFLAACAVVMLATTLYFFAPKIAGSVPALSAPMTAYHQGVDHQRMVLQDMYYQGGEPGFGTLINNAKAKYLP
jgi:predicted Zn finger-like uncharacterized protein